MSEKVNYAVLTGDIIGSSNAKGEQKDKLIASLKGIFKDINKKSTDEDFTSSFDIFRGDSFQGLLSDPKVALRMALLIRSSLIKNDDGDKKSDWDARIAIGVGAIDYLPENISEGDGPAYRNSGPVLDELTGDYKFAITVPSAQRNEEFKTYCALLDAVINKWTQPQAEIIYRLLERKTQKKIGKELDISETAVHYRVKAAGWFAVKELLNRYESIMENINKDQL